MSGKPSSCRWSVALPIVFAFVIAWQVAPSARGQPTPASSQPVTDPDPTRAIGLLREELVEGFNKGEVDRLLSHLDPDVVVTWQNAEVCRGPAAVKAFYERMMVGPNRGGGGGGGGGGGEESAEEPPGGTPPTPSTKTRGPFPGATCTTRSASTTAR